MEVTKNHDNVLIVTVFLKIICPKYMCILGSHGSGSVEETETPIVVWGPGIK